LLLPAKLAAFFQRAPSIEWGLESLRQAMATRESRFLAMVRREIYGRPRSAYARLLRYAGCTYGDLQALIRADGLESALARLAEQGVRLSEAEFRGRTDVERPGLRFRVRAGDLMPARFDVGLLANSSGSGGSPLPCLYPLEWMKLEACVVEAFVGAHGLRAHVHATDDARLTGGAGPKFMAYLGRHGIGCARWFVRDVPLEGALLRAYHGIVARELAFVGNRVGRGFAHPTVVTDADVVAWIDVERRAGRHCCIRTAVSRAVDVARVAMEAGLRLDGTVFVASGEPLTAARRRIIEASGARVVPQYGFVPGGLLGVGCALPSAPDDMHVMAHTLAVIGAPGSTEGRRRLLVTTLNARAPSIQLNVENGDLAEITDRDCGCLLGETGLRRHVSKVGSDRQLTLGGTKYAVEGLIALVEQTIPKECGGSVGDYQLVEEHGDDGRGYLTLRVHPRLGSCDDGALITVLRRELAVGSRGNRLTASVWYEADALRVVRQAPAASARGKIPAVLTLTSHLRVTSEGPSGEDHRPS
jgi:hypothetical protein